jgi:ubiquinone/menaquinone biosynthesis C-methylase UbiE
MATSDNPRWEHPSTYFVQGRQKLDEFERLTIQDRLITTGMGGVLPEQTDPDSFRNVLDVACGSGGWLIEMAKRYPAMTRLVGVDVNSKMIEAARARAEAEQVSDRVTFQAMDALRLLEFPTATFDLINQRFGQSYLRTWDWPNLLREFHRVGKPGATIRLTESDVINESTSPALTKLGQIMLEASCQAGHCFSKDAIGVTGHLAGLLSRYGFRQVQTCAHVLEYHAGTAEGENFYEDMRRIFRISVPFFSKWTRLPDNYEELYQQALEEAHQPDFVVRWRVLTAWGIRGDM